MTSQKKSFGFVVLFVWLTWWIWINTVGRLPEGLSWFSILIFDLLLLGGSYWLVRSHRIKFSSYKKEFLAPLIRVYKDEPIYFWSVLAALASAVFYAFILEPIDWDGLDYHLPAILQAVQYRQWGRLDDPYYAVQAFPKLVESLYLFWILHFGHHGYLLLGLLPVFLGGGALVRLGEHFKVSSRWLLLLWCTCPIIIKQVSSLYIDHYIAAFGLMACVGLVSRNEKLFALALAFFVGSKFSAGTAAIFLFLGWVFRYRKVPLWVFAFGAITLGGTLIPNWILFKNPMYPFAIQLGHTSLFKGLFKPSEFVAGVPWANDPLFVRFFRAFFEIEIPARWDMLKGAVGVLQGALIWVGFGTLLAGMLGSFFARPSLKKLKLRTLYLPEVFLGFLVSGGNWILRYNLWVLGVFFLWAASLAQSLPKAAQRGLFLLFLAQALSLWIDLSWGIGQGEALKTAWSERDFITIGERLTQRGGELWKWGEPQQATHPVDQQRIGVRKASGKTFVFCPGTRPQQLAAYYGKDFTNFVYFDPTVCK